MTAETLKPFITPNVDFPTAHATKIRPLSSNIRAIALVAACVISGIILMSITMWNTIRISELETEVKLIPELQAKLKTLNEVVETMQKRLGLNYLDDIKDFEKEYNNALIDDSEDYEYVVDKDDDDPANDDDDDDDDDVVDDVSHIDDDDDDDDDDDNDRDVVLAEFNENYNEMFKKYKNYDSQDEGEDEDYNSSSDDGNLFDDFEMYKESKDSKKILRTPSEREKRAIANASNGLPIYEASLLEKLNKTDRNVATIESLKSSQNLQHRSRKPVLRNKSGDSNGHGSNSERYIVGEKRDERRYSPLRHHGHSRRRKLPIVKSGDSLISAKLTAGSSSSSSTPAAHFHLNRKVPDRHAAIRVDSYSGDMYIGTPSWSNEITFEQYFNVNNGILTIKEPGLYYIYAQVCYNNSHDQNGFVIFHGHKPYLQCLNTVPTNMPLKIHTCHTSGLIYLGANETIHLRDFHTDRNAILKDTNNRSYFGVIKI